MKRVEVKLNLEAVAPLLDVIKDAADDLRPTLAVNPAIPDEDEDFSNEWKKELLEGQNSDLGAFLALFGPEFFISGMVPLDANNREAVLRACSAVRLRLRAKHLHALDDEALESGEATLDNLSDVQQRAFAAYVFLATLQELIVQHLDPTDLTDER
ncbi:MAG: hypothetical protein ABI273_08595 [Lacunisphaera sp.]